MPCLRLHTLFPIDPFRLPPLVIRVRRAPERNTHTALRPWRTTTTTPFTQPYFFFFFAFPRRCARPSNEKSLGKQWSRTYATQIHTYTLYMSCHCGCLPLSHHSRLYQMRVSFVSCCKPARACLNHTLKHKGTALLHHATQHIMTLDNVQAQQACRRKNTAARHAHMAVCAVVVRLEGSHRGEHSTAAGHTARNVCRWASGGVNKHRVNTAVALVCTMGSLCVAAMREGVRETCYVTFTLYSHAPQRTTVRGLHCLRQKRRRPHPAAAATVVHGPWRCGQRVCV